MSDWTVEDARQAAARELRRYANTLDPPETVGDLRAELAESRDQVAAHERVLRHCRAERDVARADLATHKSEMRRLGRELARLRATHIEAEDAWARSRKSVTYRATGLGDLAPNGEHWLGGDHSNQTPYPVVRE